MDSSIYIVIAAVISFLIGIIAHRFLFSDGSERLRLSSELKALKKEYSQYKTQVADSLQHTTRLFNQLQAQQDEIQTHLTQTAQTLNHSFDGRQSLLQPHSHYVAYHAAGLPH